MQKFNFVRRKLTICLQVNYYLEYLKTEFHKDFDLKNEFFGNNSIEFNEKLNVI
jgi:hypothetical protein